jgi:adenylate cyclase class IV
MGKMELEVKILDIKEKEFIEKIKGLGATFVEESIQHLYTYDLSSIYGRYIDL